MNSFGAASRFCVLLTPPAVASIDQQPHNANSDYANRSSGCNDDNDRRPTTDDDTQELITTVACLALPTSLVLRTTAVKLSGSTEPSRPGSRRTLIFSARESAWSMQWFEVVHSSTKKKSNNGGGGAAKQEGHFLFDRREERRLFLSKSVFWEGRAASLQAFVKISPVVVSVRTRSFVSLLNNPPPSHVLYFVAKSFHPSDFERVEHSRRRQLLNGCHVISCLARAKRPPPASGVSRFARTESYETIGEF
jgi:hypothetical protein